MSDPIQQTHAVDGGSIKAHQHINQDSGNVEYYTPPAIVDAARATMGGGDNLDLDPASSFAANERIKAVTFFSDNGLERTWFGNVWMNHPFSKENNPKWIARIVNAYKSGEIEQGCCITFAATSERWFQPLLLYPQCFLCPRTNYFLPDGSVKRGVTKGSVVTYFGRNPSKFADNFKSFGVIKVAA